MKQKETDPLRQGSFCVFKSLRLLTSLIAFLGIFICFLGLGAFNQTLATNYYVDNTITDTNPASGTPDCTNYNTGTFTCSGGSNSAYKTIADINAGSFSPDDQILFRKGQTWKGESLVVPSSGTVGHPITFGAFGSGANPLFDPTTEYNDFTLDSGSIWKRSQWSTLDINQVFEDGNRMIYESDKASMVAGSFAAVAGSPGTVYVWASDSGNPNSSHAIDYVDPLANSGQYRETIRFNGKSHLIFDGIDVKKSSVAAYVTDIAYNADLSGTTVADIIIRNCTVSYTGIRSILIGVDGANSNTAYPIDVTISNCIGHDDLDHSFWIGRGTNLIVENSETYNSGMDVAPRSKNYPNSGSYQHFPDGILVSGNCKDCIVRGNYVHDIYDGYYILDERSPGYIYSSNVLIEKNYVYVNQSSIWSAVNTDGTNPTISYNIINHTIGSGESISSANSESSPHIYNNVIYGNNSGHSINLNSSGGSTGWVIKNNIIVRSGTSGRFISVPIAQQSGTVIDYNDYYQSSGTSRWFWGPTEYTTFANWKTNSGQDSHSINSDPYLVGGGDAKPYPYFYPRSYSPVINAGTDVGLTSDYRGVSVPQAAAADIGAFEYTVSVPENIWYLFPLFMALPRLIFLLSNREDRRLFLALLRKRRYQAVLKELYLPYLNLVSSLTKKSNN